MTPAGPSWSATEGSCCDAIAGSASGASLSRLVSITEMTATPTELAICWVMFSNVEPRATSWWVRVRRAVVKSGIIVAPIPRPMTNSRAMSRPYDVSTSIWVSQNMLAVIRASPNGTIRPTGTLSAR